MAALPYMKFYPADYLADTSHLTVTEHGAYMLLIMTYWQRGKALPDQDDKLARICRMTIDEWERVKDEVRSFFRRENGLLIHDRIERDLDEVLEKSIKAKKSISKRYERSTNVVRTYNERSTISDTDTDTDTEREDIVETSVSRPVKPDHIPYKQVIDYLNDKCMTHFKSTSQETKRFIRARFNAGFTLDDFKSVIDHKSGQWLTDDKMCFYLRPQTLFGTKFESYLNEIPSEETHGLSRNNVRDDERDEDSGGQQETYGPLVADFRRRFEGSA